MELRVVWLRVEQCWDFTPLSKVNAHNDTETLTVKGRLSLTITRLWKKKGKKTNKQREGKLYTHWHTLNAIDNHFVRNHYHRKFLHVIHACLCDVLMQLSCALVLLLCVLHHDEKFWCCIDYSMSWTLSHWLERVFIHLGIDDGMLLHGWFSAIVAASNRK